MRSSFCQLRSGRIAGRGAGTEGGETCIALSEGGKLLEPLPTFGPTFYAVIATEVNPHEANRYALTHGYCHAKNVN